MTRQQKGNFSRKKEYNNRKERYRENKRGRVFDREDVHKGSVGKKKVPLSH